MDEMSIGEVARRAGVRPSALRFYESAGLLVPPRRRNGRRYYEAAVLQQLAVIAVAQQAGFTVAEIRVLLHGVDSALTPSARWRALAAQKLPEVEALIRRAQGMQRLLEAGLACDCVDFAECVLCSAGPEAGGRAADGGGLAAGGRASVVPGRAEGGPDGAGTVVEPVRGGRSR